MRAIIATILLTVIALICGCGGGGGSSSAAPTAAVLKLSSQGTLPDGKAVSGFGAIIELPAGVTVKTAAGGAVDASVVVPSGLLAGSNVTLGPVTYTPATATSKAKLDFAIASTASAGVGVGEYVIIAFILTGVTPTAADFAVTSFTPVDLNFADLPGITAAKSLTLL